MHIQEAQLCWQKILKNNTAITPKELSKSIAASFMGQVYDPDHQYDLQFIDLLCDMTATNNENCEKAATSAIFTRIIERLCDDFSIIGTNTCLDVLVRILAFIRKNQPCGTLDRLLNEQGYKKTSKLIGRYKRIQTHSPISPDRQKKVKKIIILSRVTAGADIAITSIIVHRLKMFSPTAKLVLIGPEHLAEMYKRIVAMRVVPFLYKNDGTLFEKMTNWPDLLEIVRLEHKDYAEGEVLLFDPDTRLSQLGLLPLLAEENSFYFPSRTFGFSDNNQQDLSTLTNKWLDTLIQEKNPAPPLLMFDDPLLTAYTNLAEKLFTNGCQRIISINFGVGNDPSKKISSLFETDLLKCILAIPNTIVILDTGRGADEQKDSCKHLQTLRDLGYNTLGIDEDNISSSQTSFGHGLISFRGSLCSLGRLIKASDCFIGYDSCGQHIASAAETPAVIVFAGAPSDRFIARWTPNNPRNKTISVLRDKILNKRELDILLKNVLVALKQVLGLEQIN